MKINKIILLITLTLIFLGITYATENNTDTTIQDNPFQETIKNTQEQNTIKVVTQEKQDNKEIKKQNTENKSAKTTAKTINITNFQTLHNTLTSDEYDTITLNIQSNIKLTDDTTINKAITKLTINGDGRIINGQDKYQFLKITSKNNVTINNIKIINCKSNEGGAISNTGTLTIINSTLNNNNAKYFGGAINSYGRIILTNSTLNNNKAQTGGAILNWDGNLIITQSTLNNNNAKYFGGAIYNLRKLTIINNTLNNNTAGELGGAIYNDASYATISGTFNYNKANNTYNLIYNSGTNCKITTIPIKYENSVHGGAIYNEGNNAQINITSTQKTDIEKFKTKITINNIATVYKGKTVTISGKFTDELGNPLKNSQLILNINDKKYTTKTYDYGKFTYKYKTTNAGNNEVTISFIGNSKYLKSSTQKTFTVKNKINTKITINNIPPTNYKNTVTITGKLTDKRGNTIKNTQLNLNINGKQYKTKTDKQGTYTYKYKTNKAGNNKITVTYNGNTNYKSSTNSTTFTVTKKKTTLTIHYIPNTHYTDTVEIHGELSTKDENLNGRPIILNINGNTVTRKTNEEGIYSYEYKTKIPGKNNITATYKGNNYYQIAKTNKTFKVTRMPTILHIGEIFTSTLGKKETITGELYNNNYDPLKNTKINLYLNGAKKTVKTNEYGYFSYTFTTKKTGKNTLTAQYIGTNKYIGSKQTITFNVDKINTKITINNIPTTEKEKPIIITGKLTDNNGNTIKNTQITLKINNKQYKTKTDKQGTYTYKYKTTKSGTNKITVTFNGNKKYNKISTQKTFTVKGLKTKITLEKIPTLYKGEHIPLHGRVTDSKGKPLRYCYLEVKINNENQYMETDANGYYNYYSTTDKIGKNTLTITYQGNNDHEKTSIKTTFLVKINTKITLNNIPTVNIGEDIPIKGKFTDTAGNPLKNTVLNVKINNEKYTMDIDETGSYNYVYATRKTGKNTITISYPGNNTHIKTSVQKTFTVTNYKKITMYMKSSYNYGTLKYINGDPFVAHYTYVNAQYDRGAYAEIDDRGLTHPPVNKIVKAIFYHKNSNGQIITNTGTKDYYNNIFKAPIISGYTPYKVDIYYTKMTQQERNNWW